MATSIAQPAMGSAWFTDVFKEELEAHDGTHRKKSIIKRYEETDQKKQNNPQKEIAWEWNQTREF